MLKNNRELLKILAKSLKNTYGKFIFSKVADF